MSCYFLLVVEPVLHNLVCSCVLCFCLVQRGDGAGWGGDSFLMLYWNVAQLII